MLLALDFGTSSVKACLYSEEGLQLSREGSEFEAHFPQKSWVEHDPATIWRLTLPTAEAALQTAGIGWDRVRAIGITNQRETTILWNGEDGRPVHNAIVWQCRRTASMCNRLKQEGYEPMVRERTGLLLDPYFSGTKIRWILDHVDEAREMASQGKLLFGTVDSWVVWNLTGKQRHVTDPTNASRTLLYNIFEQRWDPELLGLLGIPHQLVLPTVCPSLGIVGESDPSLTGGYAIPIAGIAGDQQAALFGQCCWEHGDSKTTYGTGTFAVMNVGENSVLSQRGLLTTVACAADGSSCYALEGSIFFSGALLDWATKRLGLAGSVPELEALAVSVEDSRGVSVIPAFVGLGAPHWQSEVRGAILGMDARCGKAEVARACFDAIVYQTKEVLEVMTLDASCDLLELKVDGGVTRSPWFMQTLADVLQCRIEGSKDHDLTARGAAYLAGIALKVWTPSDLLALERSVRQFEPRVSADLVTERYQEWQHALQQLLLGLPCASRLSLDA